MIRYAKENETAEIAVCPDGKIPAGWIEVTDDEYESKLFESAKTSKREEACNKAKSTIAGGDVVYTLSDGYSIEATDGNIGKLTAYALAFVTGALSADDTVKWNSKEDNVIELTQAQLVEVLAGLGSAQAEIWNVKYPAFLAAIEEAKTTDELNAIEISY